MELKVASRHSLLRPPRVSQPRLFHERHCFPGYTCSRHVVPRLVQVCLFVLISRLVRKPVSRPYLFHCGFISVWLPAAPLFRCECLPGSRFGPCGVAIHGYPKPPPTNSQNLLLPNPNRIPRPDDIACVVAQL